MLVSRFRSPLDISAVLDDAGSVGPPQNIPDILSSARLAGAADSSSIYAMDFGDWTSVVRTANCGFRIAGMFLIHNPKSAIRN